MLDNVNDFCCDGRNWMGIEDSEGFLKFWTVYIANESSISVLEFIQWVKKIPNYYFPSIFLFPYNSQPLETHFVLLLFALLNPCWGNGNTGRHNKHGASLTDYVRASSWAKSLKIHKSKSIKIAQNVHVCSRTYSKVVSGRGLIPVLKMLQSLHTYTNMVINLMKIRMIVVLGRI